MATIDGKDVHHIILEELAIRNSRNTVIPGLDGSVYIGHDGNRIKIGFSFWPEDRAKQLKIKLLVTFPGSVDDERRLHKQFSHARIEGEWFDASDSALASHIWSLMFPALSTGCPQIVD